MWTWLLVFRRGVVRGAAVGFALMAALLLNGEAGYPWFLWFPVGLVIYVAVPIIYGAFVKLIKPAMFDAEVRRVTQDISENPRDAGRG